MGRLWQKYSLSQWAFMFIAALVIGYTFWFRYWNEKKIIEWDIQIYYSYLPALFVHNDLSFEFVHQMAPGEGLNYGVANDGLGHNYPKMSMGMAYMYAPFYGLATVYANAFGYPTDGFSMPYRMFIMLSAIAYFIPGLYFFRRVLLNYFSEAVTATTMIVVVLGTNLFHYTSSHNNPMSHAYTFALVSVFLFFSIKWTDKKTFVNTAIIGLLGGLITLIRPVNVIVFLFPLLLGVTSLSSLWFRVKDLAVNHKKSILLIAFCSFLVMFPQLIFWKWNVGKWIVYSYGEEGFFFSDPKIIEGLFSYRKGWLVYSPLMITFFVGLYFIYKKYRHLFLPIFITSALFMYIIFSWWCWWYGGSFGARPMIDILPLVGLSVAAFFDFIYSRNIKIIASTSVITILLVLYSLFNDYQYRLAIIHWDGMSKEAYWGVFMKTKFPGNHTDMLSLPNYGKAIENKEDY